MKKILILAGALTLLACGAIQAHAQQGFGLYMGAGGSFAYELMDVNQYNGHYVDEYGISTDFDSSYGYYARVGGRLPIPDSARIARMFCMELEASRVPGFESSGLAQIPPRKGANVAMELDVTTLTGAVRFDPQIGAIDIFRPYLLFGGGMMIGDISTTVSGKGKTETGGDTEYDPCFKAGLGFDYYLMESLSLNMEGAYFTGFHDLDEVRYFNTSLGLAFHM